MTDVIQVEAAAESPVVDGKVTCTVNVIENDVRAKQFACKVTIRDNSDHSVDILGINYRLGSRVVAQPYGENTKLDLSEEYKNLKEDIGAILQQIYLKNSEQFRHEAASTFITALRDARSLKSVGVAYLYLFTRRYEVFRRNMIRRIEKLEIPIGSAKEAEQILQGFLAHKFKYKGMEDLLAAKIARMKSIEAADPNLLRLGYNALISRPVTSTNAYLS